MCLKTTLLSPDTYLRYILHMAGAPASRLNSELARDVLRILLTNPGGNGKELVIDVFRRLRDSNRCEVYNIEDEEDLEFQLEKYPQVK